MEDMCAFKISLRLYQYTEDGSLGDLVTAKPARYIPNDQDYVDRIVPYGKTARYYYPIIPELTGDILIFVNKTSPID